MTFNEMNLNESIIKALDKNNFYNPTEIQQRSIPIFMDNKNLFGKSKTGSGKTASFVLPILQKLDVKANGNQAIIISPTRELALQIVDQVKKFSMFSEGVNIATLIGGTPMREQNQRLRNSRIVVGTPGRIADHIQRGTLQLHNLDTLILDEADEMLKMGFKNEIDMIFEECKKDLQIGLYSATVNDKVMRIAQTYMKEYEMVEIEDSPTNTNKIDSKFIFTKGADKFELLGKVIEKDEIKHGIIFTSTKSNTERIYDYLKSIGIQSLVINGDKRQEKRTRAINQFKNYKVPVLVATDVIARGVDISDVDYVINFDLSMEDEHFLHRIGRTGRNNKTGNSITFIQSASALKQLSFIKKKFNLEIDEMGLDAYGVEKSERAERERSGGFSRGRSGGGDRGFSRDRGRSGGGDRGFSRDRGRSGGGDRGFSRDRGDRGGFGGEKSERSNNGDRGFSRDRDRGDRGDRGGFGGDRGRSGGGFGGDRGDRGDRGFSRDRGFGGERSERSGGGRSHRGQNDRFSKSNDSNGERKQRSSRKFNESKDGGRGDSRRNKY